MPKLGKKVRRAMRTMGQENAKFSKHIRNVLIPKANIATGAAIQQTAIELLRFVVAAWPVAAKAGGRSRAAWLSSLIALGGSAPAKGSGAAEIQKGLTEGYVKKRLTGKKPFVAMTNGVDYAIFLEAGHSRQAPRGVITQAMRFIRTKKMPDEFRAHWRGVR